MRGRRQAHEAAARDMLTCMSHTVTSPPPNRCPPEQARGATWQCRSGFQACGPLDGAAHTHSQNVAGLLWPHLAGRRQASGPCCLPPTRCTPCPPQRTKRGSAPPTQGTPACLAGQWRCLQQPQGPTWPDLPHRPWPHRPAHSLLSVTVQPCFQARGTCWPPPALSVQPRVERG